MRGHEVRVLADSGRWRSGMSWATVVCATVRRVCELGVRILFFDEVDEDAQQ